VPVLRDGERQLASITARGREHRGEDVRQVDFGVHLPHDLAVAFDLDVDVTAGERGVPLQGGGHGGSLRLVFLDGLLRQRDLRGGLFRRLRLPFEFRRAQLDPLFDPEHPLVDFRGHALAFFRRQVLGPAFRRICRNISRRIGAMSIFTLPV
jgi:hypothetical protein